MNRQFQPQSPPPQPPAVRMVPWPQFPARRKPAVRSFPPQLASDARPVQVAEITSGSMEYDVEVVEETSQPPPPQSKVTTRPGDITSTTISSFTEEFARINNINEEEAQAAIDYMARMNEVGIHMESLKMGPTDF